LFSVGVQEMLKSGRIAGFMCAILMAGCSVQSPEEQALSKIQGGIANEPRPNVAIISNDGKQVRITVSASSDVVEYVVHDVKIDGQRSATSFPITLRGIENGRSSSFVVDFPSPIIVKSNTLLEMVRSTTWKSGLEVQHSEIRLPVGQW